MHLLELNYMYQRLKNRSMYSTIVVLDIAMPYCLYEVQAKTVLIKSNLKAFYIGCVLETVLSCESKIPVTSF